MPSSACDDARDVSKESRTGPRLSRAIFDVMNGIRVASCVCDSRVGSLYEFHRIVVSKRPNFAVFAHCEVVVTDDLGDLQKTLIL